MSIKNNVRAKAAIKKITGPISFGEMLHSLRVTQEYSQTEMAELLGISKQDLCNIEKGRKIVSVERAILFSQSLKMPAKTFAKYALQDQLHKAGIAGEIIINEVA
ncbi:MAG: helix-turn-helix transcriptional regulator [Bacteriovoracaceae bacterium]|nr:helix-turn-helix transcriptional regulator [Bacteriovoracaceae bacterium]